jgi:aerobic-type carbon monoxide dehydrogenase small subunit (CoxS/CutS family)
MAVEVAIRVNERLLSVSAAPEMPLLYVLSDELQLNGLRFERGLAQCCSCSVLIDDVETRSCVTPLYLRLGTGRSPPRRVCRPGTLADANCRSRRR